MNVEATNSARIQQLCHRRLQRALRAAALMAVLCGAVSLARPERWTAPALFVSAGATLVLAGVAACYSTIWGLRRSAPGHAMTEEDILSVYQRCVSRDVSLTTIGAPTLSVTIVLVTVLRHGVNATSVLVALVGVAAACLAILGVRRYSRRAFEVTS